MSTKLVYVFHPNRGESDDEISDHVQNMLVRFLHENEDETFWFDCFGSWRGRFDRSGHSDFAAYLLEDKFAEVPATLFDEPGDPAALQELNACDVAGFFVRDPKSGQPKSVWQLLNANGRIDAIYTDPDDLTRPLRTKSGREVQSCLVSQLDRENTPAPDAYVYAGDWLAESWLNPISGEFVGRSDEEEWSEPWDEAFWSEVDLFSPNTRVTAVNCHN